jgi:hypothetical protein
MLSHVPPWSGIGNSSKRRWQLKRTKIDWSYLLSSLLLSHDFVVIGTLGLLMQWLEILWI